MGATKIINVLKNDKFEDVFDAFQKTEAEEVIFLFPKNSSLAKKENNFALLANEAEESQKQITIMTADQNLKSQADKYGFRFMAQPVKVKKIPSTAPVAEEEKDLVKMEEDNEPEKEAAEELNQEVNEEGEAELTMARTGKTSKIGSSRSSNKKMEKLERIWLTPSPAEKSRSGKQLKNFWGGFNIDFIKKSKGHRKLTLILISSTVIVLLLAMLTLLGKAQVIIKPQREKISFELPVSVSANTAQLDTTLNQIPGQFLAFRSDVSKDFLATGEEELVRKARGEITVFNNFNSDPQNLVASTRFESSKGLIFRIPRPISIPGAKLINGKLTPGSIAVEVIADKPGQEYNINADRFTIPGFAGTPKFEGFYAESTKPMMGGMVGLSKVVTEIDFNSAKDAVTKEALNKSMESINNKKGHLQIIEPVTNEIISLKSTAEIDDSAEGFAIAATAEAKTIGFSTEDLLKLIEVSINKNSARVLLKDGLKIDYKNTKFDFEKNVLNFTASVNGEAAAKIEEEKIIDGLLGLKQNKIESYLLGFKEIESARLVLSPFWVKSIPKNKQDVQIKIVY